MFKALPKDVRDSLATELDKRLDLDIDTVLESPRLRLQLSPAELDNQLLEFYDTLSASAGGDILRVIGGGANVGMQNLYMKRQAQKERRRQQKRGVTPEFPLMFPALADDTDDGERTPAQWVQLALRRNAPKGNGQAKAPSASSKKKKSADIEMSIGTFRKERCPSQSAVAIPLSSRCLIQQSMQRQMQRQKFVFTPLI